MEDEIKNTFYDRLDAAYDLTMELMPTNKVKIILRDFNAKKEQELLYNTTIEKKVLHENSNDNGTRFINFAMTKNVIVTQYFHIKKTQTNLGNTISLDKKSNKMRHGGKKLEEQWGRKWITIVWSIRENSAISDHFLVKISIKLSVEQQKNGTNQTDKYWSFEKSVSERTIHKNINKSIVTDTRQKQLKQNLE